MEQWDDSLILACYEKAVSEHETRGKAGDEENRTKKRKEMTGSVLQTNIGEPGPWQTFNKAEDDKRRHEKARALYMENEELNKPFSNTTTTGAEVPSSSTASSSIWPQSSDSSRGNGSYLDAQVDEALHSMMMSW